MFHVFQPRDVIVLAFFIGLFLLKVLGRDGVVDTLLLSLVSGYLGYSIAEHIGGRQ